MKRMAPAIIVSHKHTVLLRDYAFGKIRAVLLYILSIQVF